MSREDAVSLEGGEEVMFYRNFRPLPVGMSPIA